MAPDHLGATIGVTRSMMAQNVPDKAVACARRVVKLAPDETEHYEMLADTLRAAGQDSELSGVYQSLAELHRRRGDEDEQVREQLQRHCGSHECLTASRLHVEQRNAHGQQVCKEEPP